MLARTMKALARSSGRVVDVADKKGASITTYLIGDGKKSLGLLDEMKIEYAIGQKGYAPKKVKRTRNNQAALDKEIRRRINSRGYTKS